MQAESKRNLIEERQLVDYVSRNQQFTVLQKMLILRFELLLTTFEVRSYFWVVLFRFKYGHEEEN